MLGLLDLNKNSCYRVPLSIVEIGDPYVLGAYIAGMRNSTRFNEMTGSIESFLTLFGITPDAHKDAVNARMREALYALCRKKILKTTTIADVRKLQPKEYFKWEFASQQGWRYTEYPLSILFSIKEIEKAIHIAKSQKWTGTENLIEVMYFMAYLRTFMECSPNAITPKLRWSNSVAIIDYETVKSALNLTTKKLHERLQRISTARFGEAKLLTFISNESTQIIRVLVVVNYTKVRAEVFVKAKDSLRKFYEGYTMNVENF